MEGEERLFFRVSFRIPLSLFAKNKLFNFLYSDIIEPVYDVIREAVNMNLRECYEAAGADYDDVIRRFGKEERVDKFLKMFLNDPTYDMLCRAMAEGSYEEAFRAAHTMKGICMNFSLNGLLDACSRLTESLRSGSPDDNTEFLFEETKRNYLKTTAAIREHLK